MELKKAHHEAFARFFEVPTREALRELLRTNVGEKDYLDFKEEWVQGAKLARHILALANSGGGAIVFGVKELEDNSLEAVGLSEHVDSTTVKTGVGKFLPPAVDWDTFNFKFEGSEYEAISGLLFQVLIVEYTAEHIPFLALRDGSDVVANAVYVRDGVSSTPANHEQLQKIIDERLDSARREFESVEISGHIRQLRELCQEIPEGKIFFPSTSLSSRSDGTAEFEQFLSLCIEGKKALVANLLGMRFGNEE